MSLESYLKENVDDKLTIKPWDARDKFPVFLRNNYNFYNMMVLGRPCILMEIAGENPGVVTLQKHIKRVKTVTNCQVVLFYKEIQAVPQPPDRHEEIAFFSPV